MQTMHSKISIATRKTDVKAKFFQEANRLTNSLQKGHVSNHA